MVPRIFGNPHIFKGYPEVSSMSRSGPPRWFPVKCILLGYLGHEGEPKLDVQGYRVKEGYIGFGVQGLGFRSGFLGLLLRNLA